MYIYNMCQQVAPIIIKKNNKKTYFAVNKKPIIYKISLLFNCSFLLLLVQLADTCCEHDNCKISLISL